MSDSSADGRVLLVVDYPGRRPEAHVSDLGLEAGGWDVRYLVGAPMTRHLTATDYAAAMLERHQPPSGVSAILAYCTGTAIAQEIAAALGTDRRPIPMVVFDAAPSRPALITRDFHAAVVEVAGPGEAPDDGARLSAEALTDHREESFAWMRGWLLSHAATVLRADGIEEGAETLAEQSCAVYLDWLAYLIAGYNTARPPWHGEVLHLASRRHIFVEPPEGCGSYDLRRLDVGGEDLLHAPQTRELTEEFLARIPALVDRDRRGCLPRR